MKNTICIILGAAILTSCGESESVSARKEAERQRVHATEMQRREIQQRKSEQEQRAIEKVIDVFTR
jgi:hypothetical protein